VLTVPRALAHVMWRDEWQTWLLCRASPTLTDLWHNRAYDGHPLLWYLLVWPLTKLTADPLAMKVLHVALASTAVWVMARLAPFSRVQKALLAGGYFLFFEYAVITRNYAAAVLSTFAFCAAFVGGRVVLAGAMLFLLAQTSAYGAVLAAALALVLTAELLPWRAGARDRCRAARVVLSLGVVATGLAAAFLTARPPGPSSLDTPPRWALDGVRLVHTLTVPWQAMAPIPRPVPQFWNTNVLDPEPPANLSILAARDATTAAPGILAQAVLGTAVLVGVATALRRRRALLAAWVAGTGVMLAFIYLKYFGSLRHHGHLALLLTALLWVAPAVRARPPGLPPPMARRLTSRGWTVLLIAQAVGGAYASYGELALPFSASREAAVFVRSRFAAAAPVVVDPGRIGTPIAGCLGRPVVFAETGRLGTFTVWDATLPVDYPIAQRAALDAAATSPTGDAALLTNYLLPPGDPRFELLEQFPASVVPDEVYVVYRVRAR